MPSLRPGGRRRGREEVQGRFWRASGAVLGRFRGRSEAVLGGLEEEWEEGGGHRPTGTPTDRPTDRPLINRFRAQSLVV